MPNHALNFPWLVATPNLCSLAHTHVFPYTHTHNTLYSYAKDSPNEGRDRIILYLPALWKGMDDREEIFWCWQLSLCVYALYILLLSICAYVLNTLLLLLCVYSFHYVFNALTMWLCGWKWLVRILQWEMTHNDPLFKSFHYVFIAFIIWFICSFLSCHLH